MVSVALLLMIVASIGISRALLVKSECNTFGAVWAKAILSEYDVHLFEDYKILGYHGNEIEVEDRLNYYLSYSAKGKLDASIGKAQAELGGYELRDPDNFKKAIKNGIPNAAVASVLKGEGRKARRIDADPGEGKAANDGGADTVGADRKIANTLVLDTLPSKGVANTIDVKDIISTLKGGNPIKGISDKVTGNFTAFAFIHKYLNSHTKTAVDKPSYFTNEWEYIISGKPDDERNYKKCKRMIFLIRNGLNLTYLAKDPMKMEAITAASQIITPGPLGALTQTTIMEIWAGIESEYDVQDLIEGGRVPLIKDPTTWKTDIGAVFDCEKFAQRLDNESKKNLAGKRKELSEVGAANKIEAAKEGNDYEDYLMFLMLGLNENTRMLRLMDIVQINMKYRYYEDFNLAEYYSGVKFALEVNGRDYSISDEYR